MVIQNKNNVVLEYEEQDEEFAKKVIQAIDRKAKKIMDFFGLSKIENLKIKVWADYDEYKEHFLGFLNKNNKHSDISFVTAHTNDQNINLLPTRLAQKTGNSSASEEELLQDACHEFVHICQQKTLGRSGDQNGWFWEALATNLGNEEQFDWVEKEYDKYVDWAPIKTIDDLAGKKYKYVYCMGKYMLENIPHEEIIGFIKNPDLLEKNAQEILDNTKIYCDEKFGKQKESENKAENRLCLT